MKSIHKFINTNANNLDIIPDNSVHLIVTSPPYPMVEMWDEVFIKQNTEIANDLQQNQTNAFEKMHEILNEVWKECERVLVDGGFACINIGDATRTFDGKFQLFSNHTKIIEAFSNLGFTVLPDIHWRKRTNAPNKFMGSGMYPAGAYVTYEHEYILIFRKGDKRKFDANQKIIRQQSSYFWEERNEWFADLWEISGTKQTINQKADRTRNGSYPIEIPYRLINMYSIYGDTVLDPFSGLGTTTIAAILSGRSSFSIDISKDISTIAIKRILEQCNQSFLDGVVNNRIKEHEMFIENLSDDKKDKCYKNKEHNFLVKTKQEMKMKLYKIIELKQSDNDILCKYEKANF